MHTIQQNLDHLFSPNVQYQVPRYQRHYVWNEANWSTLWCDILSQVTLQLRGMDSRHFMGAIVTRRTENGQINRLEIIDGQQRLATFQIILCALRDICQSDDHTEIAHHVNHLLLNSPIVNGGVPETRYKFLPTSVDKETFCPIVDGDQASSDHHAILHAYTYFKEQIAAYVVGGEEKINGLLSSILNDLVVVQIILDSSDTAENIFASLNTGGRQLSEFDLLRNNIFLRAGVDSNRLFHEYWQHFDDGALWTPETLDQFLHDFLTAKLGIEIETGDLFNVYEQHYRATLEVGQGVEHELAELRRYAAVYLEKIERDA